jgi:SnoaL-like domain
MTMDRRTALKAVGVLALGLQVGAEALRPAEADNIDANEMIEARRRAMSNVNEIVVRYLSVWNERDATRRRDLVAKTWSEDGTYVDGARQGAGYGGIDAMIAKAQETFPGYRLALASGIETHHQYVRFSWVAGGTAEAPLYIKGTDIGTIADDGRLKSVIGFVDAAPAKP